MSKINVIKFCWQTILNIIDKNMTTNIVKCNKITAHQKNNIKNTKRKVFLSNKKQQNKTLKRL